MPNICVLLACPGGSESAIPCLRSLAVQSTKPDTVIILSGKAASSESAASALREFSNIKLIAPDSDTPHIWDTAFDVAFRQLSADFVWILSADCTVSPTALETLLETGSASEVRVSLISVPEHRSQLSLPVITESRKNIFAPWHSIFTRENLPQDKRIPIRGGWIGALYPRSVISAIGKPGEMSSLTGNNEEYAWKVKLAGIRFSLIKDSEINAPLFSKQLIHYQIGGRSFFYEPGLPPEQRYYKIRNWAWIQRLRKPGKPLLRLIFCGLYIILSLNAMLKCNELSFKNVYTLFRALHNGFYGKLRPYSPAKN